MSPERRARYEARKAEFAAEMEAVDKLPTILAVQVTGPASLRLTWSDGINGELNLTGLLADRHFETLRDPDVFALVGVGEWGHSLAWPSGVELGADTLRHEMELTQMQRERP
ncbi:DUF2442 domain-containing protein [Novosphingobium panipatense]|uniref:DUF2442 domain-containing protein n=1 Tax=Novosphingobium panipatense TaxID=428991 RepID=UPI0036156427